MRFFGAAVLMSITDLSIKFLTGKRRAYRLCSTETVSPLFFLLFIVFYFPFTPPMQYRPFLFKGNRKPDIICKRCIRCRYCPAHFLFQLRIIRETPLKIILYPPVCFPAVKSRRICVTKPGYPAICQRNVEILFTGMTEY